MSDLKIIQLAKNHYQVTIGGRTSVGDLDFMKEVLLNEGYVFHPDIIVPIAGIEGVEYKNKLPCPPGLHNYVEMGFTHSKIVCKYCDVEKENLNFEKLLKFFDD